MGGWVGWRDTCIFVYCEVKNKKLEQDNNLREFFFVPWSVLNWLLHKIRENALPITTCVCVCVYRYTCAYVYIYINIYVYMYTYASIIEQKGIEEWWNIACFLLSSHFPFLSLICNIIMRKLLSAQNSDCVLIICEREQDYCTCKYRYVTTWPPGFIIPHAKDRRTH